MLDRLVSHLKDEEGFVPHAYEDHLGWLTIGYGFLIDKRKGGAIPEAIAEQWLHHEAAQKWWQITSRHPWLLDQPEEVQVAIGSMTYQLGVEGVSRFTDMLSALKLGDREQASRFALESKWATVQTPERAKRVAAMIRGPK